MNRKCHTLKSIDPKTLDVVDRLEIQSELDLARHLANCGARPVLEALRAVERGVSVDAVLRDFARLPSGCDRPRLPGAAQIVAMSGDGRGGTQ